jgi:two-component system, cell cycle response regulator DivK
MKKRILIVEDNERNRMLEKDLLEIEGFEVLEAADGASGISLARKERPDAIVLDARLPDMRGTQVARLLKEEPATSAIPVIFVSASVVGEVMEEMAVSTARLVLPKPIDTRTFAQKIRACMEEGL